MFKLKSYFLLFLVAFLFSNCSTPADEKVVTEKLSEEDALFAEIKAIDALSETSSVAASLRYSKENGESEHVRAYLNESGKTIKIDREFNAGNNGNFGVISFYMKKDILFASKERFEDHGNNELKFVERISFYNPKGEPIRTLEKRVDFEMQLEDVSYQAAPLVKCDLAITKQILDQVGPFETTFQGFAEADDITYLIVGEAKENGFTSAMRSDYIDSFFDVLKRNPKSYLNRKIRVSFETITDSDGFEFQVYKAGSFTE